jgi:hypothetical protein
MTTRIVANAAGAAARVRAAVTLHDFKHAVDDFVRDIAVVPDEPAGSLTADAARTLQVLSDDVIDHIEERVADIESGTDARDLVGSVYEIRRLLEEMVRWRQH